MIAKLPYGEDTIPVDLRGLRVRALNPTAPPGRPQIAELVGVALDRPIDGATFSARCRTAHRVAVVVPDSTRRVGLPEIMPAVLKRAFSSGIEPEAVSVLVACGTHPPVPARELQELVGPLPAGVDLVQHDCRDEAGLTTVGQLPSGRAVSLNTRVVEADLVLTIGAVRHHYFAGFGGGPKLVFPGVAGYREIQENHALVLTVGDQGPRRHPGCEPGLLAGNPVAEEIAAAADLLPSVMSLCLVPGREGGSASATAGPWRAAFAAATARVREWFEAEAGPFRLMVASGGGTPADSSLIQAHKALDAACRFLEPGGELLLVARLDRGAGSPEMEPFLADPTPSVILDRLSKGWIQYGHTTLRLVEKTSQFAVYLHSELDGEVARRLGFLPVVDPAQVIESWRESHPGAQVGVIPGAPVFRTDLSRRSQLQSGQGV